MIPDSTGFDLYPLIREYAAHYGISERVLLACLEAESGLNPTAARYGNWPDVSFGLGQQTVAYAPVGDGSSSADNIAAVRAWLFDRENAIKTAAFTLSGCKTLAQQGNTAGLPSDPDLLTLVCYNAGHLPPAGDNYWVAYRGNVANYTLALQFADEDLHPPVPSVSGLKGGETL